METSTDDDFWQEQLKNCRQTHILEMLKTASNEERTRLYEQLEEFNGSYNGGISAYWNTAVRLLRASKEGVNPYEGMSASVPTGEKLDFHDPSIYKYEELGIPQLKHCCFVLVAGGLGERLGYPSIKIGMPVELVTRRTFLEFYIENILAIQNKFTLDDDIPLAIMTSADTHQKTLDLLVENDYFGMKKEQVTLMKQGKVLAIQNNEGQFALKEGKLEIIGKPHGHGDVHSLIYNLGVHKKWLSEGRKWILLFQDTNPLIFRSLAAFLGASVKNNFEMNSLNIPRKKGEKIGAICLLKDKERSLTLNVEYNQLQSVLDGEEKTDEKGFSEFPGNTNTLLFDLKRYVPTLEKTSGIVTEFVNPKYTDENKTKFKSATRLECMMQDYPKLLKTGKFVGFTQLDPLFCFSPVKNNLQAARDLISIDKPGMCALTCESDLYKSNAEMLRIVKVHIHQEEKDIEKFEGIEFEEGPKIVIKPSFAMSLTELRTRFENVEISGNSTVVFEGESKLKNVVIDGSYIIKDKQLENMKIIDKNYTKLQAVDINQEDLTPYLKIRGYNCEFKGKQI